MDNKQFSFKKLTPIKEVPLDSYDEAFKFVFKDRDLKNVAISGAYGAGKSSLLETYKSAHPELKFINISLASSPLPIGRAHV